MRIWWYRVILTVLSIIIGGVVLFTYQGNRDPGWMLILPLLLACLFYGGLLWEKRKKDQTSNES
ncbi:hypothetical protein [Thalassobacillus sp. C254]|uniref:hypothetical protein n=1 Tax=Thalassobacillus sp. C254 TaxID=1225341 RepID=UPI0006CFED09|nr:hypothetical protein [Thalassobacillus sp. C254]